MAVMPKGSAGACPVGTCRVTPISTVSMAQVSMAGMPAWRVAIQRKSLTFLRNRCIRTMPVSRTNRQTPFSGQANASQRSGPTASCKAIPAAIKPQQKRPPRVIPQAFLRIFSLFF